MTDFVPVGGWPTRVRLNSLAMINRIVDARSALQRKLDALKVREEPASLLGARPLAVTVDGESLDEAMLALVRPVIEKELRARLASIDRDLRALGVDVD